MDMDSAENQRECQLGPEEMEGICVIPGVGGAIKAEHQVDVSVEDPGSQNVAMGIKFILPNRFDMNVCSRFVKSLNEEDSKNIQDQVNSDLEVASVLFKGTQRKLLWHSKLTDNYASWLTWEDPKMYVKNKMFYGYFR